MFILHLGAGHTQLLISRGSLRSVIDQQNMCLYFLVDEMSLPAHAALQVHVSRLKTMTRLFGRSHLIRHPSKAPFKERLFSDKVPVMVPL